MANSVTLTRLIAIFSVAAILAVAVNCGKITDFEDSLQQQQQQEVQRKLLIKNIPAAAESPPVNRLKDLPSSEWKSLKRSKFLTYLFRKYGSGGMITFEGLEHMMHNLGLGGLEFSPEHPIEEHHPEGYRVYEEGLRDDGSGLRELDVMTHYYETSAAASPSTTTERSSASGSSPKHRVEIKISDEDDSEEIVLVKESQHRRQKDDEEITVRVKSASDNEQQQQQKETPPPSSFISKHDPKHRHSIVRAATTNHDLHNSGAATMSCLSPSAMIRLLLQHRPEYLYRVDHRQQQQPQQQQERDRRHVNNYHLDEDELQELDVNALTITPTDFVDILCPAILTQIERDECLSTEKRADISSSRETIKTEKKLFQFAWLYASISILIISMCGLVGVAIVPLMRSTSYNYILMFLVAVAIGTLAGDALMHLLPHALTPHLDHGDDTLAKNHNTDEAVYLCAFAFLAALVMYILETLLPLLLGRSVGHNHSHGHGHGHSAGRNRRSSSIVHEEMTLEPEKSYKSQEASGEPDLNLSGLHPDEIMKSQQNAPLSPIAFMVIIGDGLHNITDGLAIGAAFAFDPITGMATALAVLCHELPHELGDFALLLKTGVSIKRALILNVISSVLSLFGMAFGLIIAGIHTSMVRWIYAATAGTFLYIAFVDLIPEMSREPEGKTFKSVLCQVAGILIGGLIMLTIALNEDRLRILFE